MNARGRQDTPSTLSQWSSLSEEIPSYSKLTLGLSPSIFSSFLFPQQVGFGDIFRDYDSLERESTPSCPRKKTRVPLDLYTHADNFTTPPLNQRGCRFLNLNRTPATAPPVKPIEPPVKPLQLGRYKQKPIEPPVKPLELDRYKQKPQVHVDYHNIKHNLKYENEAIASRARQEAARKSDPVYSSPTTPSSSPKSLYSGSDRPGLASEEDSTEPYMGEFGGIKPPCFKLAAEFSDEPKYPLRSRKITGDEFYHFINGEAISAVMFYIKGHKSEDNMKAWEANAEKESLDGERAFATVDCAEVPYLCLREHIPSVPFFKVYSEGHQIYSGPRMKVGINEVVTH
ncbi:unnamed protein product [Candidula unifasciata]|uniref:Uncharacterized protein n=1 Tax=Candidula unifasciata TaxID=100452 RepID=A0A8S4A4R7_9EUPU|nr:unnamed protein product [Candidula unifasciata]